MKSLQLLVALVTVAASGCGKKEATSAASPTPSVTTGPTSLPDARKGFTTKTHDTMAPVGPAPAPPPVIFSAVRYPSPVGPLAAYVTPSPRDGKRP